ncbi:MAG: hypothetical protein IH941_02070 [Acidobacteria bacterium]|nr:hypothetical protein [Acidobacteriota bacterium]
MGQVDIGDPIDKPFTSDHCTAVTEYDHAACCVRHDWLYWQGGSRRDRKQADLAFYKCMRQTAHWRRAGIRRLGVRFAGVGFLPTPWRWGYGWKWPRSSPTDADTSYFTAANQREVYQAILKNAEDADTHARKQQ